MALVLPSAALASMTVYDLDTDTNGHYTEQITVPAYEYFKTPLRASSGNEVLSNVVVDQALRQFTGSAAESGGRRRQLDAFGLTDPQLLTDEQASNGVQFFFRPRYGYIEATFSVTYSGTAPDTGRSLLFAGDSSLCPSPPPMPPMSSAGFTTPRTHASSADGSPPFGEPQQPMSGDGTPRAGPPVRRRRWEKVLGLGKKRASVERD